MSCQSSNQCLFSEPIIAGERGTSQLHFIPALVLPRGCLHLFNHDVLLQTIQKLSCPREMIALRPVLGLLAAGDERLELALKGEVEFWHQFDR